MKTTSHKYVKGITVILLAFLFACSPSNQSPKDRESLANPPAQVKASVSEGMNANRNKGVQDLSDPNALPVRFQSPSYTISDTNETTDDFGTDDDFVVKVGADISSTTGPVQLRDIMKKLASLKKMNISWASDVDQYAYVDVDIRADDDFFKAIDNLLRQRDYYHEVEGNTIVVNYKETKRFHLPMPFMKSEYSTSVGGKVTNDTSMNITSSKNSFSIWDNVKLNLDKILQIWSQRTSLEQKGSREGDKTGLVASTDNKTGTEEATKEQKTATSSSDTGASLQQSGLGYYTIDEPVGIITVTAPRYQLTKIEEYLNALKKELFRQINIEAKILEVKVTNERRVGIDWDSLLNSSPFSATMTFGPSTLEHPFGPSGTHTFTFASKSFNMFISAIEKQGKTKVLSNPKLSVMNGQPALINVGKQVTYVKKVTESVNEGTTSYEVQTEEKTSGIVMSVVATIMDNDEIILNLTPVTSQLEEPIPTATFGAASVGLPTVNVKEMSTLVKVKEGEMLVVGGLIDSSNKNDNDEVPLLGRIPFIKRLFSLEDKTKTQTELVILLKPEIVS